MKPFVILFTLVFGFGSIMAQVPASNLIPKPVTCTDMPGCFELKTGDMIFYPAEFLVAANLLTEWLQPDIKIAKSAGAARIVFAKAGKNEIVGAEGYTLKILPEKIGITAFTPKGAINAALSLVQLQLLQPEKSKIPCASISDSPRFSYRGMHLDVSRNFFPVSFIKKYIDLMALYRYNTFHWHLTDGPGWRLEIKKYPELTRIAAFRTHQTWVEWWKTERKYSSEGDPNAYGGYYTRKDAREIVEYASRRGITVIPEIEVPGHSEEVLAVFPKLSCSGKPYESGEFCIGNPETYTFLENVLSEVIEIFPSTYIHIGGDEANTAHWAKCEKCQKLKTEKGLKNEHELQAYLIKHIERFLKSKGRKLIGWDEIIDGGLPADATVMSWRGMAGGIKAVQQGHDVVMTPGETYLDAYQSDPTTQPEAIGGFLTLGRVYNFDPVPTELPEALINHILGTQANLWTEFMPVGSHVEYMAWPRAAALAEVAWSRKDNREFDDFHRRLQAHYLLFQRMNVNYYRPSTFLTFQSIPDYELKKQKITITSEQYNPEIRYSTDGNSPTIHSALYSGPFYTSGKTEIKAAIFKNVEQQGKTSSYTADYHKAIGKKVIFNNAWDQNYPAQKELTLTNGIRGSLSYSDKQWLGYLKDFDVTVDMESVQPVTSVSVKFMHQPGPGVFLPSYLELQCSDDGKNFVTIQKLTHNFDPEDKKLAFKTFEFSCGGRETRYIRITGPNVMKGYMFMDEIVVY